MNCKRNARPRLTACVIMVCAGAASWANALDWAKYYSRLGTALSIADYACFSQRLSLIPPLIVPLMMFCHGISHTGIYAKRNMYLYPSRGAYWRKLCLDALTEALVSSAAVTVCSILPGFGSKNPLSVMNWSGAGSVFALMTGGPLQAAIPPVLIFAGCWAAACLQITAYLVLYSVLECRFRPFAAFIAVLLFNLAFNSPVRHSVWDQVSLNYGRWAEPSGAAALLAGWLAFIVLLCVLGGIAYRKADVL